MDLSKFKIFYVVASSGSLTKAAQLFNVSHSSLSKSIAQFEDRLNVKLFKRLPRGLQLTPEGEKVYALASRIIQETDEFKRTLTGQVDELEGEIKIMTTPSLGAVLLTHYLLPFLDKHPNVKVRVITQLETLATHEADVLVRTFLPHRPDLVQSYLTKFSFKLWASQTYLDRFGTPQTAEELDHHRLLAFEMTSQHIYANSTWLNWLLYVGNTSGRPRQAFYQINSYEGLYNAAVQGHGIAQLPKQYVFLKGNKLTEVLPGLEEPKVEMYYIYPKKLVKFKRIITLYEYLQNAMQDIG